MSASDACRALVVDHVYRIALELFPADAQRAATLFIRISDDEHVREAMSVAVKSAVGRYRDHKGQKALATLRDYIAQTPLFTPQAVAVLRNAAEALEPFDCDNFVTRFAAERPTGAMLDVVRGIASEVVSPSLVERLVKRLESDRDFMAALRRAST